MKEEKTQTIDSVKEAYVLAFLRSKIGNGVFDHPYYIPVPKK